MSVTVTHKQLFYLIHKMMYQNTQEVNFNFKIKWEHFLIWTRQHNDNQIMCNFLVSDKWTDRSI